jgi:hypothetical protein
LAKLTALISRTTFFFILIKSEQDQNAVLLHHQLGTPKSALLQIGHSKKERYPRGGSVLSRVGLWTKEKGNYFFYLLAKSGTIVPYAGAIGKRQEATEQLVCSVVINALWSTASFPVASNSTWHSTQTWQQM